MIEAINLSHGFETELYSGVSISAKSGESIAILGVSGSGKSTILNNLSTLLKPQSGTISILNKKDIYSLSSKELLDIRRTQIGIVFQSHYLFKGFNGIENIEVASILSNQKIDYEILEVLGIKKLMHQNIGELSGGQQQRLSIARVLTKKPKVLFADEPTGNLDKATANSAMDVFFDYIKKNRASLIFATHDVELAKKCTKVYVLKDRKLIEN